MKLARAFCFLIILGGSPIAAHAQTYNAVTDFSVAANPNGQWSYLVSGSPLTVGQSACNGIIGIACWNNGGSVPNFASISNNTTGSPIAENGSVTLPPGEFNMDPESLSVIVTWTAPSAGNWSINGFFSGLDTVSNTHPVEVVLNSSTTLFSTTDNTAGKVYSFSLTEALSKGDVLDFKVDTGNTFTFLGTGFDATISNESPSPIPEPSSWSLFVLGLAGLAASRCCARSRSRADIPTQV